MKPSTILCFVVATILLLLSSCTNFCRVAALRCYHCVHLKEGGGDISNNSTTPPPPPPQKYPVASGGGRTGVEQDKYGIPQFPHSSLCKNDPQESFLVTCDSLNYEYADFLKQILRNLNVSSAPVASSNSITAITPGVVATKQNLNKFTCAKFLLEEEDENATGGREFTLRTCIPTFRDAAGPNESSCAAGKLQELQEQVKASSETAIIFLKVLKATWFTGGDTMAVASTCNGADGCNGPSLIYNQCDPPQNSTVVDSANNNSTTTTTTQSPRSIVGGSGQQNPLPPTLALLVALLIVPCFTSFIM